MSRGVNKVILVGNLGADPETRYTTSGSAVSNIRVATSRQWRDRNTNEMQEDTQWHRVVLFGRLGEVAGEYLRKGSKVYIEGRLQTRSYQDQQGQERWITEIVAEDMQMLDSRSGGSSGMGGGSSSGGSSRPKESAPGPLNEDFDDDIPF